MSRVLEQKRASFALEAVRRAEKSGMLKYGVLVHRLPAMILTNGLGQSMAFLLANVGSNGGEGGGGDSFRAVYDDLARWLVQERRLFGNRNGDLIELLIESDRDVYFRAQEEVLCLLNWLKKFAAAYLETKNS